MANPEPDCPCQSGLAFKQCCQRFLDNEQLPQTAEQLMRSRYCAYVLKNNDYLLQTWHPRYRPDSQDLNDSGHQWIGLKIKNTVEGQKNDTSGQVHFIARFKINGKAHKLEENSQFEKINGRWFYLNGEIS